MVSMPATTTPDACAMSFSRDHSSPAHAPLCFHRPMQATPSSGMHCCRRLMGDSHLVNIISSFFNNCKVPEKKSMSDKTGALVSLLSPLQLRSSEPLGQ